MGFARFEAALFFLFFIWVSNAVALEQMNVRGDQVRWTPFRLTADVTVIEHFAHFCVPCQRNVPNVNALARRAREANLKVEVLHMANDETDEEILAWYKKVQPNHPVIRDADWSLTEKLRRSNPSTGVPATYVVDARQNVLFTHVGMWESSVEDEIMKLLEDNSGRGSSIVGPSSSPRRSAGSAIGSERDPEPRVKAAGSRSELD